MRSRARRAADRVFTVELDVHRLDSIPTIHRLLHIQWRARRAVPAEGRTPSLPVEPGNVVRWNSSHRFQLTIPAHPADASLLQPAPLVLHLRSERRARWRAAPAFINEGVVEVDLAEVAAVAFVSRNYLVKNSLLNTTLNLSLRVTHRSGDKIFRTRAVAAPLAAASAATTTATTTTTTTAAATANAAANAAAAATAVASAAAVPTAVPAVPLVSASSYAPASSTLADNTVHAPLRPALPPYHSADARVEHVASASADLPAALLAGRRAASTPATAAGASASTSVGSVAGIDPLGASAYGPGAGGRSPASGDPASVLESSIPNPELLQQRVYERMFQAQLRDEWPAHIVASRVDAAEEVNRVYAAVCKADGIGVAAGEAAYGEEQELPKYEKTLSLELLIESRDAAPQRPGTGASMKRKASGKTLRAAVRSSSAEDFSRLARQTTA